MVVVVVMKLVIMMLIMMGIAPLYMLYIIYHIYQYNDILLHIIYYYMAGYNDGHHAEILHSHILIQYR